MTVHFIGAGPGASDLITVRGQELIKRCPVCLYAGSLIPDEIIGLCPPNARVVNTAPMSLNEIEAEFISAHQAGDDIARLQSGDLSIWSALGEQIRRLKANNIPYTITPGVPSFAAAAASLGCELTLPEVAQTVVLTRTPGRASAMPSGEKLSSYAATGATLAIHLSVHNLADVVEVLTPHYGATCPVGVVYRASWPDEQRLVGTLSNITEIVHKKNIDRTAVIIVGPALGTTTFRESALYSVDYQRRFRNRKV